MPGDAFLAQQRVQRDERVEVKAVETHVVSFILARVSCRSALVRR